MEEAEEEVRGSRRQRERTIRTEEGARNISVAISHVTAALRRRAPLPLGLGRFEFNRFAINKQGDTAPMHLPLPRFQRVHLIRDFDRGRVDRAGAVGRASEGEEL